MVLSLTELSILVALVFAAAVLYSSGGHGGASAYLAAMALVGVAPAVMKPTALLMNIVVATVGTIRFTRAKAVPWPILRWLCLGSIPAAFLGGSLELPAQLYRPLLGVFLLFAAARLWFPQGSSQLRPLPAAPWFVAIGAALGFVSGLTGIGGGIFLTPLLILSAWEEPRRTGGAAAVFILVNSVLGFFGHLSAAALVPAYAGVLAPVALAGGLIGSWVGVNRLSQVAIRRVNTVVLIVSGGKLVLEGFL